jgi:hypothetical protein
MGLEHTTVTVPDAAYVRRELRISDLAMKLGLDVRGRWVRCPYDRGHWARVWVRKNAVKCFHCRRRPLSTIDLVVEVLGNDVGEVLRWIAPHFDIPRRRLRVTTNRFGTTRHAYVDYQAIKGPARLKPCAAALRRSPGWPRLSHGARLLAAFLLDTIPRETLVLTTTYRELQRNTGIGNRGTLKRAFGQLAAIGLVETAIEATGREIHGRLAGQTTVRLTWGSEAFQSWLNFRGAATKYIGSKLNQVESRNGQETEPGTRQRTEPGEAAPSPSPSLVNSTGKGNGDGSVKSPPVPRRDACSAEEPALGPLSSPPDGASGSTAKRSEDDLHFGAVSVREILEHQGIQIPVGSNIERAAATRRLAQISKEHGRERC